eukprot:GHVQ01006109.1.p1 GENE.GHVQ01006109.1~~GHVQ01006109.1.p1  ORF type:complete len:422 (+),score=14.62 GHVQ01006109.1:22-1266(+)
MRFFIKFVVTCLTSLWILCPSSFIQPVSATQTEALRDRLIQTMTAVVILAAEQGGQQNDLVPMANAFNGFAYTLPKLDSQKQFEAFLPEYLVIRVTNLYVTLSEVGQAFVRDLPVPEFNGVKYWNIGTLPIFQQWVTDVCEETGFDDPPERTFDKSLVILLNASQPTEASRNDLAIRGEITKSLSQLTGSWLSGVVKNNSGWSEQTGSWSSVVVQQTSDSILWHIQLSRDALTENALQLKGQTNATLTKFAGYNKIPGSIGKAKEFVKTLVPVEEATSYGVKPGRLSSADSSVGLGDVTFDSDSDSLAGSIGKAYNRGRGPEKSKRFRHRKARKTHGGVLTKQLCVILKDCMKTGCVRTKQLKVLQDCMKKVVKSGSLSSADSSVESGHPSVGSGDVTYDLFRPPTILALSSGC